MPIYNYDESHCPFCKANVVSKRKRLLGRGSVYRYACGTKEVGGMPTRTPRCFVREINNLRPEWKEEEREE